MSGLQETLVKGDSAAVVHHPSGSKLSIAMAGKLKKKTHDWRVKAHEHALDHGMAIGFGDMTVAAKAAKRQAAQQAKKTAGEDHHDDDHHEEKSSGQTNMEAIMNLLNNCLGSGVLCVPFMCKSVGIGCAVVMLVISAILNRFGLTLILKAMQITGVDGSYNGVGRVAFGNAGRMAVVCIFICMGFGCLVSYVDATASAVGGLLQIGGVIGDPEPIMLYLQAGSVLLLFPATYIRSLKNVAPISIASFIGALVVVACVVGQCIIKLSQTGVDWEHLKWKPESAGVFLKALPTALTVFSIQAGGSITMSTLADSSEANKSKVSLYAYIIVLAVNLSIGLPSYMNFKDATTPNIIDSLDPSNILTIIAKASVMDLVIPSYMFMMIPCRVALIELIWKKNEGKMEAEYWQFLLITTCVNIAAVLVGMAVKDLSLVIGLVGAVAANSVAFILPCLFFLKGRSKPALSGYTAVPMSDKSSFPYYFLVCFSLFSMVSGIYFLLQPQDEEHMIHIGAHGNFHHAYHPPKPKLG